MSELVDTNGILQIVNLLIYVLSMVMWLVSLAGFLFLRNVQPFKARSHPLLILLLCCIPVNSTKYFLILRGTEDCVRDSWIEGNFCLKENFYRLLIAKFTQLCHSMSLKISIASFGNATMFIYFMRAYRLLVIFNVTKRHFEDEETAEKQKVNRN
jgi:hypothetical protein